MALNPAVSSTVYRFVVGLLIFLTLGATAPVVMAQNFCQWITKTTEALPSNFAAYRGEFISSIGAYEGRLVAPGFSRCRTSSSAAKERHEYKCTQYFANESTAKSRFEEVVSQLKVCRGDTLIEKDRAKNGRHVWFKGDILGEAITVMYVEYTGPSVESSKRFGLSINIRASQE